MLSAEYSSGVLRRLGWEDTIKLLDALIVGGKTSLRRGGNMEMLAFVLVESDQL